MDEKKEKMEGVIVNELIINVLERKTLLFWKMSGNDANGVMLVRQPVSLAWLNIKTGSRNTANLPLFAGNKEKIYPYIRSILYIKLYPLLYANCWREPKPVCINFAPPCF